MLLTALLLACAAPEWDGVARAPLALGLPLQERERFSEVVGVDHDPVEHEGTLGAAICTAFDGSGFPSCYDGHTGTDYLLQGGFEAMDSGSTLVVAAASGVVVEIEDDNYDRCHAQGTGIDCDGHPMRANRVVVQHPEGVSTLYWHLATGSVVVEPGQWVSCGTPLALVGSSGRSSKPHLHFELRLPDGSPIDPYAGPWSQPETWWAGQQAADGLPEAGCTER